MRWCRSGGYARFEPRLTWAPLGEALQQATHAAGAGTRAWHPGKFSREVYNVLFRRVPSRHTRRHSGKGRAGAVAVAARVGHWSRSFVAIPIRARECSCADFRRRDQECKHILAVRLWVARQRPRARSPLPPCHSDRPEQADTGRPLRRSAWRPN